MGGGHGAGEQLAVAYSALEWRHLVACGKSQPGPLWQLSLRHRRHAGRRAVGRGRRKQRQ